MPSLRRSPGALSSLSFGDAAHSTRAGGTSSLLVSSSTEDEALTEEQGVIDASLSESQVESPLPAVSGEASLVKLLISNRHK